MNKLTERLCKDFHDEETRDIYAEDFLNTYIATQIKVLREKKGWTQAELAERAGMGQERISVLEDVNHSSWTASVLKRIAKAFDMRLSIKIESFGSFLPEFENFNRESLLRPSFEDDPVFQIEAPVTTAIGSVANAWATSSKSNQERNTVFSFEEHIAKKAAKAQQASVASESGRMKEAMSGR